MVVDIRYHLASLVAVFLALGLGILVGTSLSGKEGWAAQEEWLTSLERQFSDLQERRQQEAALLQAVRKERDLYADFASELSALFVAQGLKGERAALVLFGGERKGFEPVETLLHEAGAAVTRRVHVQEGWNESPGRFASVLTLVDGERPPADPGLALAQGVAASITHVFTTVDAPALWYESQDGEPPTLAVFVLFGKPGAFSSLFASSAAALRSAGVRLAAVVAPEESGAWESWLAEASVPSVSHLATPMGRISLVALLGEVTAQGIFGLGQEQAAWPSDLLGTVRQRWSAP